MPYQTTTLDAFRELLKQRWDGSVFWTDDEARLAANEALRDWNLLTGRWRKQVTYNTAANTPTIDLGTTLLYGMRVRFGTSATWTPLHPTSLLELDLGQPQWRVETTASGGAVPARPLLWAPESLQRIAIWPATAAITIGQLVVDGVSATPVLTEDGDYFDIGEEHLDVLADYALHIAAFKEGGPRWQRTMSFWQGFLQAAAEENGRLKRSQKYRRLAGLDRRRDMQPPKDAPNRLERVAESGPAAAGG